MKRFMFFTFSDYYPNGGLSDCDYSFDTLEEAIQELEKGEIFMSIDSAYIFDRITGEIVKDFRE